MKYSAVAGDLNRLRVQVRDCGWYLIKSRVTFTFDAVSVYLYKRVKLYQTKTTVDKTMKTLTQAFKRTHEIFRHI